MKITFAKPVKAAASPKVGVVEESEKINPSNRWDRRGQHRQKIARYREFLEAVQVNNGHEEARLAAREICKRDIFYLAFEVLKYRDMFEPLHDDLCDFLATQENSKRSTLVLIPRSHYKSTIATITRCIWWLIRDPNTTIGLGSATLKNARKFLMEIRNHMEAPRLHALFPEIFWARPKSESPKWTETEVLVKRTSTAKEPSIKVFGLEENIPTGDHYQKIVLDDVVDQETVANENRIVKIKNQLRYVRPLRMTADQPIHYVGTRYHVLDPYGQMIDNPKISVYLRAAIEGGEPIFGSKFSKESLDEERVELGSYIFSCQYMMKPVEDADKKFKIEWLKYHDGLPPKQSGFVTIAICDPANAQKKQSDFTAIGVFQIDWTGKVYLVDCVHDKLTPTQRIDAVMYLQRKWKFDVIGYETIGFQQVDSFYLQRAMVEKRQYFRVIEINNHAGSKRDRIEGIQPMMEAGNFLLPRELVYKRKWENPDDGLGPEVDITDQFRLQYNLFPYSLHDDLLDMLQMVRRVYTQPGVPQAKKPEPDSDYKRNKPGKSRTYNPKTR
jgi:phage terminase large subunit-like protein